MASSCLSTVPRSYRPSLRLRFSQPDSIPPTLLPFLYQTRTILRHNNNDASVGINNSPRHRSQLIHRTFKPQSTTQAKPEQILPRRDLADRLGGRRSSYSDPLHRESRQDYVPFEGSDVTTIPTSSTITDSEFKAFERLFEETVHKGGFGDDELDMESLFSGRPLRLRSTSAHEIIDLTPDHNSPRRETASKSAAMQKTPSGPPDHRYENRRARFDELRNLMDQAQTDHELWQILHQQVFSQLKALELDNPQVNEDRERRRAEIQRNNIEISQAHAGGRRESLGESRFQEDSLDTWAAILPQLLVHFSNGFRDQFPGSSLSLALLPALKEQGPSEFALGASTALYNRHMWLLWKRNSDLSSICRTLEEMDRAVFSFNGSTLTLINDILTRAQMAYRGQLGAGQQLLWSSERKRRHRRKLYEWKVKLQTRLVEERFRKARMEQRERIEGVDELDDGPYLVEDEPRL